jgi:hypothetical protein
VISVLSLPSVVLVLACLGLAVVSAPAQSVLTVGPAGFANISLAVAAAGEGDLIVVQDGYIDISPVVIDGKSLGIVAEGSAVQTLFALHPAPASIEIRNLAPSQSVTIRGIEFRTMDPDPRDGAYVQNCAGAVVFEECLLQPRNGFGLNVQSSASVTVRDCTLSGGLGLFVNAGLRVKDSRVQLYESSVLGGDGSDAVQFFPLPFPDPNGDGGDGAWILGTSQVFASGVTFAGGNGGKVMSFCFLGGDAGHGLVLGNGSDAPVLRLRDCTFTAGTATPGGCGNPAGAAGSPQLVLSGSQVPLAGVSRDLELTSPASVGDNVTLSFDGEPGDAALLLVSLDVAPGLDVKLGTSVLHLALPLTIVTLGALPGGDLDLSSSVPALPVGLQGLAVAAQAVFANGGQFVTSGPTLGVLLGP